MNWRHCVLFAAMVGALVGCRRSGIELLPGEALPAMSTAQSADVSLAVEPDGDAVYLTWVGGDETSGWRLYASRSTDGGDSWSVPVPVTLDTGLVHPHGEAAPRLVAGPEGKLGVLWTHGFAVPGRQWPATRLLFSRSLDRGASWSPPVTLNDDTTGTAISHTFQGMTWTGATGLTAAWLDERGGGMVDHHHPNHDSTAAEDATIYAVSSDDFGVTWSANRPLWAGVCPCCRVALARRPDGSAVTAWRKHFPGNVRDVVLSSLDHPEAAPVRIHRDDWKYAGCPHSGPAVAVDASGVTHVVWYTGKPGGAGVFLGRGNAPIALLEAATLPAAHASVATLANGGTAAAWDVNESGDRMVSLALVRANASQPQVLSIPESGGASYPHVAALGGGRVLVAWTQTAGEGTRLRLLRAHLN